MTVLTRAVVAAITAATAVVGTGLVSADAAVTSRPESAAVRSAATRTNESSNRPPIGYQSNYARVNGFRMHYLRGGSGSPVVLLHGFPQTSAEWEPQLQALAKNHTVIAVDLRGTGDSSVPETGYDTTQLANDVHTLLAHLKLNKGIQIVAHDIGAWIAYPYAAMWPTEVSRMVVMEGPIPDRSLYTFPAFPPEGELSTWHLGFFQKDFAQDLVRGHERDLVKGFIERRWRRGAEQCRRYSVEGLRLERRDPSNGRHRPLAQRRTTAGAHRAAAQVSALTAGDADTNL